MIRLCEARLVKVEVFNDGASWSMQWNGQVYVHHGDTISFAKLLQKIKASDDHKEPRSYRSERYIDISNEIASGSYRFIWVWEHMLKKLGENKEMRQSTIDEKSKTAKCPDCGKKYLVQTGYCVSCKKKVAEPKSKKKKEEDPKSEKKKEEVEIVVEDDVRIPGTDIILEKGDVIKILESMQRDAFIYKAKDGSWYYFIADEEYGEYPDGDSYGPFGSQDEASNHMMDNHSNPGGYNVDKSGKRPVPKVAQVRSIFARNTRYY